MSHKKSIYYFNFANFIKPIHLVSSIVNLDFSHNKLNVHFLTSIFESLSTDHHSTTISINLASCIKLTTKSIQDSLMKFLNHVSGISNMNFKMFEFNISFYQQNQETLESINISHFNMEEDQLVQLTT